MWEAEGVEHATDALDQGGFPWWDLLALTADL